jgi:rhomboid protease GluP
MTRIRFLTRGLPIATFSLIIANVIIFVISQIPAFTDFIYNYGEMIDRAVINDPLQSYRFVTAMFLHASILHIGLNMLSLYFIGVITERVFGTGRFLIIYFVSGSLAGWRSSADASHEHPGAAVGASGAILASLARWVRSFFAAARARSAGALIGQWFFAAISLVCFSVPASRRDPSAG